MRHYILKRGFRNEAEVRRAGRRMSCFGLKLVSGLVQVDLLRSKSQRLPAVECDRFHAQSGRIKGDRCVYIGYRQNKVVEVIDGEAHLPTLIAARWPMAVHLLIAVAESVPVIVHQRW